MNLTPGVYETLISNAIERKLKELDKNQYLIHKEAIDSADSDKMLADYLSLVVSGMLKDVYNIDNGKETISAQIERINRIFKFIEDEFNWDVSEDILSTQEKFLRGIYSKIGYTEQQLKSISAVHPTSGYRVSNLFTGSNRDLSIDQEMIRDIQTSDQIDIVVSFIRFTGLRIIIDQLTKFVQRSGTKLRIITTSYMGASDPKAVQRLYALKTEGDVEIKVSYNTNQERLHAKAYIFKRNNGYDTAYIGSSNLSESAMTKGLEWNIRVTNVENPHIIEKAQASFDSYWNSAEFEAINSDDDIMKFTHAIFKERSNGIEFKGNKTIIRNNEIDYLFRFQRKTHQIKVLDKLKYEREVVGSYRNLIIAATGTGKTAISAFDFKDFNKSFKSAHKRNARLLFVVHRDKILRQARATFRSVLVDSNYGELWVGKERPSSTEGLGDLFVSIQTFNSNIDIFRRLPKDYYDYIVLDEAHHSTADSYRELFSIFDPKILIGLTATPERMDGKSLKPDFNNRFAAEIRLYEALNQQLLSPFNYFCVTDTTVDLSKVAIRGEKYDVEELNEKLCTEDRFVVINNALENYVADPFNCKAICFCASIEHAEYMAGLLSKRYNAVSFTSKNKSQENEIFNKFQKGEIQFICVADILNEGVDIPEIDTILFLRPTESLTVFLQQLGRGLRTADGKTELTVLDFVAQANKNYSYESRFRALIGRTQSRVADEVATGFTMLPRGCSITMEKVAREFILQNIKDAIFSMKRLRQEIAAFTANTGDELNIEKFLEHFSLDPGLIYKNGHSWYDLMRSAGVATLPASYSDVDRHLEKSFARLLHINSYEYLDFIETLAINDFTQKDPTGREKSFMRMFYYVMFDDKLEKLNQKFGFDFASHNQAIEILREYPDIKDEMLQLVKYQRGRLSQTTKWIKIDQNRELELYGCYSFDEVMIMVKGDISRGQRISGVITNKDLKLQMFFVTLNKSDKDYSPTTMYHDYAIDENLFHWQSQNNVRRDGESGLRYINQSENGWRYLLFVRDSKKDGYGMTNSYYCLGFVNYMDSHGECPMNITWSMQDNIPGFILEAAKVG